MIKERNKPEVPGRVLVIIPTYNEVENIGRLTGEILEQFPEELQILVIDDSSPDGTAEVVRKWTEKNPRVHLICRSRKSGLGTAYLTGFSFGLQHGYDYMVEMDADYSHDPASLPQLLATTCEADLVIGSRYMNNTVNVINWPLSRLILSKAASLYTRIITGMPVSDPTSGYKCFSRSALQRIDLDAVHSQGYSFQIEMNYRAWKAGLRIAEIPIVFTDRTVGQSKMSRQNILEAIWIVWRLKFAK
ncbi:polyprenol monophosphomannose synthase [Prosthecochloris sp. CIB 2401]|uniref:polyprenol monophosphomannose synthase n=1 Tax=Prosthecochloris sp. CIB 2401 TaxID=1868325 RepID=UPI00080AAEA2|nr:polyprenol monophosphomannose synthase [Prosthecochloris sp. CIB 2401]ANT64060.1 Undecaprenyl-phosphate 4-deoxy-4-formamido-L-arabinose transferase [Prosthecochloris sp. CIB 2401]